MSNQVREIQLGLALDPELASDRLALAALQHWYQRADILNSDNDSFDFFKLRLHKDIYLSGLFLCLLEPKLVKYFSRHLHTHSLTAEFLHRALEEHRLMPAGVPPTAASPDQLVPDELANHIVEQLSPLLNAQGDVASLGRQNAQLQSQVNILSEQLQEQARLLRQQTHLLERLARGGGANSGAPGEAGTPAVPASGDMQVHDLSETAAKVRKVREKGVF